MSFILDALRKSEHDRQRQTGPTLAEVPVAAPKPRSNVWAPVVIVLLLVNLVVIGVLLVRKAAREPAAAQVATAPAATSTTAGQPPAAAPAPVAAAPPAIAAPAAGASTEPAITTLPPSASSPGAQPATAVAATDARPAVNPLEAEASGAPPMLDPTMAERAAAAPPGPPAVMRTPTTRGSVVYESLPDSATVGGPPPAPQPATNRQAATTGAGLPSADELAAAGVPALNLDLHVFSTVPGERLIFVNSHKYREGDTMQEGPVVRQITPAGAVLEYNGRDYLLSNK